MRISQGDVAIELVNEPTYAFESADNARVYSHEINLAPLDTPTSCHGLLIDGIPVAVFGNSGGATGVHANSAVLAAGFLYVAVGDSVVCVRPLHFELLWSLKTDFATCFGVYFNEKHQALVSHGELEVVRFTSGGQILWRASGADIFSEGFALREKFIEVVDFNGTAYHLKYENGENAA